jgi:hypothetical protein
MKLPITESQVRTWHVRAKKHKDPQPDLYAEQLQAERSDGSKSLPVRVLAVGRRWIMTTGRALTHGF